MMKKTDGIFIGVLLGVGALLFVLFSLFQRTGAYAVVLTDGVETARYPLSQEGRYTLTGAQGGSNVLVIADGSAYMSDADCPDLLCVKTGAIRHTGEVIVCLPHRIVVQIEGEREDAAVDAVAQ